MSHTEKPTGSAGASSQWLKSNLVALGSAAVLAVYAAGYVRTRSAAQRFAVESDQRRPAAATGGVSVAHAATPAPAPGRVPADSAPPVAVNPTAIPRTTPPALPRSQARVAARDTSPRTSKPADSTTPPAPSVQPTTPPVAPVAVSTPVTPVPTDTATQPADKERAPLKDGVYTGWGTSRHGDIQASVEIKGGRITAASISQCLTRYSCSWISALPPQVVVRQSADVDYVSGATQSTNAFYYAVVEALQKAK